MSASPSAGLISRWRPAKSKPSSLPLSDIRDPTRLKSETRVRNGVAVTYPSSNSAATRSGAPRRWCWENSRRCSTSLTCLEPRDHEESQRRVGFDLTSRTARLPGCVRRRALPERLRGPSCASRSSTPLPPSVDLVHEPATRQRRLIVVGVLFRPVGQLHLRAFDPLVGSSSARGRSR
jgi:hypothetical protein